MKEEKFSVRCEDGVELKGILLIPDNPKAVVQFNTGTAALKDFYKHFLLYLAEHGYACCLWDYRGNGESAPETLKGCEHKFSDYGTKDMPAVKTYLKEKFPDLPLILVGHSAGGQQVGLMPDLEGYKGLLAIATSTGYEPHFPLGYRLQSKFFFGPFASVSIALFGYVKSKPFGIMEDLPKNVAREWNAWMHRRDYLFDERFLGSTIPKGSYHAMPFPIEVVWTPDDTIANERNTEDFWSHVKSAQGINFTRIEASEIGEKSIGHFGFFKRRVKDKIWPILLEKLDGFLD